MAATTSHAQALAALIIGVGAAGCGFGPVEVAPHEPEDGTEQVCADFVASTPEVLADAVRREVSPPSSTTAAWGQPPIVLRCGVPAPVSTDPTTGVLVLDDIGWLPVAGDAGTFFTTVDRVAAVEVAVPDDYAPESDVLLDLTPVIEATLPPADAAVNEGRADG